MYLALLQRQCSGVHRYLLATQFHVSPLKVEFLLITQCHSQIEGILCGNLLSSTFLDDLKVITSGIASRRGFVLVPNDKGTQAYCKAIRARKDTACHYAHLYKVLAGKARRMQVESCKWKVRFTNQPVSDLCNLWARRFLG